MSNRRLSRRALAAIAIVPLSASLACSSGGAKPETSPEPPRPSGNATSVGSGDGKTIENMFAGRFPGVTVTQASGGGLLIRIRGGGSGTGYSSAEPLYVVDETPLPDGTGGILYLNPYDIEKIEVLKNPADTGIYGVRGANGVIKITTKRPGR